MATGADNFYDRWLRLWEDSERERAKARAVIHEEELEWIETPQDYRIALMAGPENGFRTWGSEVTIAEIPPGYHTGKHEHGEEGIYIVEGEGFSVVNGIRYDWTKQSCLWMPFGAQHQHYNTGLGTARYLSFTALHLEHFAGLGRIDQWEEKGFTDADVDAELSADGLDPLGRRIVVTWSGAPVLYNDPEEVGNDDEEMLDAAVEGHVPDGEDSVLGVAKPTGGHHRDFGRRYMRDDPAWANRELEISGALGDLPGRHGGKHAHMEAFLYIIDGEGYTVVDGERVDWKKGSLVHVQGPQTPHQHFNDGEKMTMQFRLSPGLRYNFFQRIARERFPYLVWGGRGSEPQAKKSKAKT